MNFAYPYAMIELTKIQAAIIFWSRYTPICNTQKGEMAIIMENKEQKYVYLVLSSSSSVPARLIKFFSRNKLNHSSITLDITLHKMYSFGRLKMYNAFYAGLVKENKDEGFYKKFKDTYINLYRLPVSREVFEKTDEYLLNAYENRKSFKYNFLGVMLVPFQRPVARKNQYFCSEFVATVVNECGIRPIKRNVHTYRPHYFEELTDMELIYDGMLADYTADVESQTIKPQEKEFAAIL